MTTEQKLYGACLSALQLIKNTYPYEHGNAQVGKTWGLLEDAIGEYIMNSEGVKNLPPFFADK